MKDPNVSSFLIFFIIIICIIVISIAYHFSSKLDSTSDKLESSLIKNSKTIFQILKSHFDSLNQYQKKILSIFLGWTFLHLIFFFSATENENRKEYFWPLDRNSNLKEDYGVMELLVYLIVPSLIFYFYNYLNKPKNKI